MVIGYVLLRPYLLIVQEMVGLDTGRVPYLCMDAKAFMNLMKAGTNLENCGVLKNMMVLSWGLQFSGEYIGMCTITSFRKCAGRWTWPEIMQRLMENGIGSIRVLICTKFTMQKRFAITCSEPSTVPLPMRKRSPDPKN